MLRFRPSTKRNVSANPSARASRGACAPPLLERLEDRVLLSAAPTLDLGGPGVYQFHTIGETLTFTYTASDPDSPATLDFYIDTDRNPNNGHVQQLVTARPISQTPQSFTLATASLNSGVYYVYGKATDSDGTNEPVGDVWNGVLVMAPTGNPNAYVMLNTSMGNVLMELYRSASPISVANFLTYAYAGFYSNTVFHRVSTTYNIAQGGGQAVGGTWKAANDGILNENEYLGPEALRNLQWTVGCARTPDPFSTTSQFYINAQANPVFDYASAANPGYAVFGEVIAGRDVVTAMLGVPRSGEVPVTPIVLQSVVIDRSDLVLLNGATEIVDNPASPVTFTPDGSGNMTFTVRNQGAVTMTLGQVQLANNAGYTVTQQPAATVAPGASTTFTLSRTGASRVAAGSVEVSLVSNDPTVGAHNFTLTYAGAAHLPAYFDERGYLLLYPDIAAAVTAGAIPSGYFHFANWGVYEGRRPNLLFDESYYAERNPNYAATGLTPVQHFLVYGADGSKASSPFFDESWYRATYPEVASAITSGAMYSGLQHFLHWGQLENRNSSPFVDTIYYLQSNPDVASVYAGGGLYSAFDHFLRWGQTEGRSPTPYFDAVHFRTMNPDVHFAVTGGALPSTFYHFLRWGQTEGRSASPFFREAYYCQQNPAVVTAIAAGTVRSGLEDFIRTGAAAGRQPSPYYNETFYLAQNPDISNAVAANAVSNGYAHWIRWGRFENRRFSAAYDEAWYLSTYPEIAAAIASGYFRTGLEHFLLYGEAEGRLPVNPNP